MKIKVGKTHDKDMQLSIFICSYLFSNAINSMLQTAFGMSGTPLSVIRFIIQAVLAIELVIIINHLDLMKIKYFFIGLSITLAAFAYSFLMGASMSAIQTWAVTMFTVCVPIAVCARLIEKKSTLYTMLLKFSIPITIVLLITALGLRDSTYSMHYSYGILVMVLLHFCEYDRTNRRLFLILSIVEFAFMVLLGSRGAIVCVAVFFIIKAMDTDESLTKKVSKAILLALVAGIALFFYDDFSSFILSLLRRQGTYSRSIYLLLSGNFVSHDSGRNELWAEVIELIKEKPIWGWGIGGAMSRMPYAYPHQLYLDLFLTFGVPFGLILGVIFTLRVLKLFTYRKSIDKYLLMIFGSASFVSLMFSGSVFSSYYFAIFLGLSFSMPRRGNSFSSTDVDLTIN